MNTAEDRLDGRNLAMDLATIERICLEAADEAADSSGEYDHSPMTFLDEIRWEFEKTDREDMTQLELSELYDDIWGEGEDGEPEVLEALMAYDRRARCRRSGDMRWDLPQVQILMEALKLSLQEGETYRERLDRNIAKAEKWANEVRAPESPDAR